MWHVSSRSGVATLRTAIHLLLTCYLLSPVGVQVNQTMMRLIVSDSENDYINIANFDVLDKYVNRLIHQICPVVIQSTLQFLHTKYTHIHCGVLNYSANSVFV